jgi:hypothetical protein
VSDVAFFFCLALLLFVFVRCSHHLHVDLRSAAAEQIRRLCFSVQRRRRRFGGRHPTHRVKAGSTAIRSSFAQAGVDGARNVRACPLLWHRFVLPSSIDFGSFEMHKSDEMI